MHVSQGFYALDVGRGFATAGQQVSMKVVLAQMPGFYALDVGRGFATLGRI